MFRDVLTTGLKQLLPLLSDEIREIVEKAALELRDRAKNTPNPWDDMLVSILIDALQVDRDPDVQKMDSEAKRRQAAEKIAE